jgi:hypothetical protein
VTYGAMGSWFYRRSSRATRPRRLF